MLIISLKFVRGEIGRMGFVGRAQPNQGGLLWLDRGWRLEYLVPRNCARHQDLGLENRLD
jgi:hypothetical protein